MSPKVFFFIAGLPRSGSTLLTTILNQNPNIHAGPNSPVLNLMEMVDTFRGHETNKAFSYDDELNNVRSSILDSFYSEIVEMICIDKNREWTSHIQFLRAHVTPNPKIICPIRSLPEILNSFLHILEDAETNILDGDLVFPDDLSRCKHLLGNGVVAASLQSFMGAVKAFPDNLFLCDYDSLLSHPEETFKRLYGFLDVPHFHHDFVHFDNPFLTDDLHAYGVDNLHKIHSEWGARSLKFRVPSVIVEECSKNPIFCEYELIRTGHSLLTCRTNVICRDAFGGPGT
ncbi:MAG: hypothetical protein CMM15_10985 [Rhodospirillaceae bacterium]|nr:hypothetical protein [Rhodospirillaceae bacterium]OUX67878.1 MAG: hypothetical protein CBD38_01240 [bacterium TMED178]